MNTHGADNATSLANRDAVMRLARRFGVRPSKRHSQNFLLDASVIRASVATAGCGHGDWVLEVGAGFGALTEGILASGAHVAAFEIDERLAAALLDRFRTNKRFTLVVGDFFRWFRTHTEDLACRPYQILSNLPYHASSHFFEAVLSSPHPPSRVVTLLQREVAERIVARPGAMSLLSLSVQLFGSPAIIRTVPRSVFWPEPDVDSALLAVTDIHHAAIPPELFRVARMAFSNRRKQIHNSLEAGLHLSATEVRGLLASCGIKPDVRPQELSVADWIHLGNAVAGGAIPKKT
jgi:16S rRNA (adenine1518-N6/adenine1519-N6)-dimethyltransferase